jgi:hypothetical protein
VELLQSLQFAHRYVVRHATTPSGHREVTLPGRHTVEWLPGTYQLAHTLLLPDAADCAIKAQGTYFRYAAKTGDATRIPGMLRCRYQLGTIESHSTGAAIRVTGTVDADLGDPAQQTPCQMSVLSFTGLIGQHYRGTGLLLDNARPGGITVNRFTGTDIAVSTPVFESPMPRPAASATPTISRSISSASAVPAFTKLDIVSTATSGASTSTRPSPRASRSAPPSAMASGK